MKTIDIDRTNFSSSEYPALKFNLFPNVKKIILFAFALFAVVFGFSARSAFAFTCTATAGGGTWSSSSTWSGCNSTVPQTGDAVVLSSSSGNVTVSATTNGLASLDMTGYAGTLAGAGTITVAGVAASTTHIILGGTITWTGSLTITNPSGSTVDITTNGLALTALTENAGVLATTTLEDNLTFSSSTTDTLTIWGGNLDLNGHTIAGNSATNRVFINNITLGVQKTIAVDGGTFANADFRDIKLSTTTDLSAITGGSGDCGGNANITFTASTTTNFTNTAGGNWSTPANWSVRVPLPQDNATFNTAFGTSSTITEDMPRMGHNIDWTGATYTTALTWSAAVAATNYGSITLIPGMTWSGANNLTMEARTPATFTSAGVNHTGGLFINAFGGTVTLGDSYQSSAGSVTFTNGNFNANGFNVTALSFVATVAAGNLRTITMGTGTWTATGTGVAWSFGSPGGGTLVSTGSTIVLSNTAATAKTFAGGGLSYNNVIFSGDNITVTGSSTFNTMAVNNAGLPNGLILTSSTTQTVSNFTTNGSSGNLAILKSSNAGAPATLSKATGTISVDWMSIKDSTAAGGAAWYAGANSTNVSGNSGWIFTGSPFDPPKVKTFFASPSLVLTTGTSTLSWNVTNASSVVIDNGALSSTSTLIGSATVHPASTTVYTVTATNTNGTSTATTTVTVTVDSTPPSSPTSLFAIATGTSTVSLFWASSTDTSGPGLSGYNIFRCTGSCVPSTLLATSSGTSFNDSGLTSSTVYTYAISAYDIFSLASATSSNASTTTQGVQVVPDGLVGYWKFDEGSGSAAYDSSGNNSTATGTTPLVWITGKEGTAVSVVNGSSTLKATVNLPTFNYPFTFTMWSRATGDNSYFGAGIALGLSGVQYLGIGWTGSSEPTLLGRNNVFTPIIGSAFPINTWTHIAGVFTSATQRDLYVNEVLVGSSTSSVPALPSNSQVFLGSLLPTTNLDMDEVRLYNRALSAQELLDIYDDPTNGGPLPPPPPDTTPPVISTIATSSVGVLSATISWTTNELADAQVEYGTSTSYGSASFLYTTPALSHYVTLSGLAGGTLYHFRVDSKDPSGNLSTSTDYTFQTLPLPDIDAPTNLQATSTGSSQITLTWDAVIGAVGYNIYRSGILVGVSPTSSFQDMGLSPSTLYGYNVTAVSNTEESLLSVAARATTSALVPATHIYEVGAGKPYTSLLALPKLYPGDEVDVYPGVYYEAKQWSDSGTADAPIVIKGVGSPRPIINAEGIPGLRGVFQITGSYVTIENFEIINANNGDLNAAAIRVVGATNVTIRNNYLHDNDWGIGTSLPTVDNLLIEYNNIGFNAAGPFSHNLYLDAGIHVRLQYNYIHDSRSGENLKIRMQYPEVFYNYISDSNDGEVEIIQQDPVTDAANSNAVLVGNVIISHPARGNRARFINFGSDDPTKGTRNGTLYLFNNTLIAGTTDIDFVTFSNSIASPNPPVGLVAKNNLFYGSNNIVYDRGLTDSAQWKVSTNVSGSNNWFSTTAVVPTYLQDPSNVIGTDPGFQNFAGRWLQLTATSTARDAGTDNLIGVDNTGANVSGTPTMEYVPHLLNNPRAVDSTIDIGAYEFGSPLQNLDTVSPTTPSQVVATAVNATEIKVTWTGSTDDVGVAGYKVYDGTFLMGSSPTTEFDVLKPFDIYIVPGRSYVFSVQAYDAAGNISAISSPSNTLVMPTIAGTPPVVSGGTITINNYQPILLVNTDEFATCRYSKTPGTPYSSMISFAISGGFTHTTIAQNYIVGENSIYYVRCQDALSDTDTTDTAVSSYGSSFPVPTISSFAGTPSFILSGASSTLSFDVSNASSISISPGGFSTSTLFGSLIVNPTSTTTYTLTATNANGTSTDSMVVAVDAAPPTTPTSVVAFATGPSTITLSWADSTDPSGPGVAGYNIYRCTGSCTPSMLVATSSITSYYDSGLATTTRYAYAVSAYDSLGLTSATSSNSTVTTLSGALPTINSFSFSSTTIAIGSSSLLSWSITGTLSTTTITGNNLSFSTTTASGSVLVTPNATGTLIYTIAAANTNGTSTATATLSVVNGFMTSTVPQNLLVTPGDSSVFLAWDPPISDGNSAITQYLIYDRVTGSPTFSQVATTSVSQLNTLVSSLTDGLSYDFEVFAQNGVGISSASTILSTTPFTVSDAPMNVTAVAGNGQATITFTPPLYDGGSTIQYYGAVSSPDSLNPTGIYSYAGASPIIVTGLTNGTPYTFTVTATNEAGDSLASGQSNSVTPQSDAPIISAFSANPSTILSGSSSVLSWSVANATLVTIDPIGISTAFVGSTTVNPASTTIYTLTASNDIGTSTQQTTVMVNNGVPPTVPQNLSATAISSGEIDLLWSSSTSSSSVAGYIVYEGASPMSLVQVATTSVLAYDNIGLAASTAYYYTVAAFDQFNNISAQSTSTSATTQAAPSGGGGGGGGLGSSGGGGGGGGGGGYYYAPPAASTSTSTVSTGTGSGSTSGGTSLSSLLTLVQSVRSLSLQMFFSANTGNLSIGSTGNDVWAFQVFLIMNNALNPTGPAGSKLTSPTGYFGSLTQQALAEYQAQVGISPASGLFGPKTRAYLQSLEGGTTPTPVITAQPATTPVSLPVPSVSVLSFGSEGSSVTTLQNVLVKDGYLSAGTFTQGTFDPATLRAVQTFQCLQTIACSASDPGYGDVGPKTRAALRM